MNRILQERRINSPTGPIESELIQAASLQHKLHDRHAALRTLACVYPLDTEKLDGMLHCLYLRCFSEVAELFFELSESAADPRERREMQRKAVECLEVVLGKTEGQSELQIVINILLKHGHHRPAVFVNRRQHISIFTKTQNFKQIARQQALHCIRQATSQRKRRRRKKSPSQQEEEVEMVDDGDQDEDVDDDDDVDGRYGLYEIVGWCRELDLRVETLFGICGLAEGLIAMARPEKDYGDYGQHYGKAEFVDLQRIALQWLPPQAKRSSSSSKGENVTQFRSMFDLT